MSTPDILRDENAQNVLPPFSNAQLNETATHREILNIYQHARPETKRYYDMGRDTQGLEEENWVIRWLLWHVFRYRDNRNKNRRQGSPDPRSPSSSENSSSESQAQGSNGTFVMYAANSQTAEMFCRQYRKLFHRKSMLRPGPRHLTFVLESRCQVALTDHWSFIGYTLALSRKRQVQVVADCQRMIHT